jgi:beta-glucosidase
MTLGQPHLHSASALRRIWIAGLMLALGAATAAAQPALTNYDVEAKALLAKMTIEEKIGQMCQADQNALQTLSDIEDFFLGALLSSGDSKPKAGNNLAAWTELVESCQNHALKTRLGIPLLYGIDAVHGDSDVQGAVIFPHNIGLGCARNPELVTKIERITAEEVRATGINWAFAPCVAVPQDARWGRTYEGFSEDSDIVSSLGAAAVRGFQDTTLSNPLSVAACAKHYLGDGGTPAGSGVNQGWDQGDTRLDEESLLRIHVPGYIQAVRAGVASIMPSYSSWNGVKCSANKHLLTDVLKNEIGFQGLLISDYNAIEQVDPDFEKSIELSINAGMDMVMLTSKYRQFCRELKELVAAGKVPMARIDDAVLRILRVKFALGLMDKSRSPMADRSLWNTFGSAEHRAVARQAVRESLVLLKNDKHTLPLAKTTKRIHVGGRGADDLAMQCGGWTIDWQGIPAKVTAGGTTILAAIRQAAKTAKVSYSQDGAGGEGADVGILVIGERPYAEWKGDNKTLALASQDVLAFSNMKGAGIPVVVILLSGRPLILGEVLNQADAFIAAWLPGTEGEGIADVLFGDAAPEGKLSITWPRSVSQMPINVNTARDKYSPLFKFGYGLGYPEPAK